MIGILCASILAAALMFMLIRIFGIEKSHAGESEEDDQVVDGAARREEGQRGLAKLRLRY